MKSWIVCDNKGYSYRLVGVGDVPCTVLSILYKYQLQTLYDHSFFLDQSEGFLFFCYDRGGGGGGGINLM